MRKFKKGFTIVELVIVIAVIAVLTAVLVPTFIHLTNKANKASDESLVTNLNKALAMREAEQGESGKNNTMYDAVLDLKEEGYLADRLVSKSDQKLLWSQKANRFFLNESYNEAEHGKRYNCFHVEESIPSSQEWGIYAGPKWIGDATGLKVSFDAGEASVSNVSYVRTEGTPSDAQVVVIRTNGGSLEVKAPADTVNHYGEASVVSVKKVATESYHLFGEVTVKMTVEDGRAVVEKGGKVATLEVAKGAQEIVATNGSKVENLNIASDADIQSAKLQVESGSEVKVVVNNSATVDTTAIAETGVNVVETQSTAAQGKTLYNITRKTYSTGSSMSSSGDYILLADLTMWLSQTVFASPCSLDLNGHSITNSTSGRPVVSAGRSGSSLEIKGNGELIQNLTDSNSAVVMITNENVKIGEGVKMSGGAVGVWCEGTSRAYSVEIAGQYSTTLEGCFGVYRNGTNKDTEKCPTITIKKTAKFEVPSGAAVYGAGYAVWNFEGGEFKSNECLEFKSGIVTISGGKFETTAAQHSHTPNGNGTSANGYALVAIWNDGYAKPLTVTLNGGEFVGPVAKLNDSEDASKINSIVFNNNIGIEVL